jgi:hypothetical protein
MLSMKVKKTKFRNYDIAKVDFKTKTFECHNCPNRCEVVRLLEDNVPIAYWGDKCERYSNT